MHYVAGSSNCSEAHIGLPMRHGAASAVTCGANSIMQTGGRMWYPESSICHFIAI